MKPTKLAKISGQLADGIWARFLEMELPNMGAHACVMHDTQARNRFVRQGWVLFVARNKKGNLKSMSLHPSHGAKLP